MNPKIQDIKSYQDGLNKNLNDKIDFFINQIDSDIDYIIDFGSANGSLMQKVIEMHDNIKVVCIDNNRKMRKLCYKNMKEYKQFISVYKSLKSFERHNSINYKKTVIILSSVVHELFYYLTESKAKKLLYEVFNKGFSKIIIRDMSVSSNTDIFFNDKCQYYKNFYDKINKEIYLNKSWKFYLKKCKINEIKLNDVIQFLFKYQYSNPSKNLIANWERECKLNYFPLKYEELRKMYMSFGKMYDISYEQHYIPNYIYNSILEDFKISLKDLTHYKLIFSKNNIKN